MWLMCRFLCAGSQRAGHVLLGPGHLDLDSNVTPPLSLIQPSRLDFNGLLTSAAFLSDVSRSRSPPGRSMLTMTCVSDEALFIYGGLGMDGNTLGESCLLSLRFSCLSCGCFSV